MYTDKGIHQKRKIIKNPGYPQLSMRSGSYVIVTALPEKVFNKSRIGSGVVQLHQKYKAHTHHWEDNTNKCTAGI